MDAQCQCGKLITTLLYGVVEGNTTSCGCWNRERCATMKLSHGRSGTPEHRIWVGMIKRCTNPKTAQYQDYGGRGIAICEKWRHSFAAFLADVGERPSSAHTIERRENDKGYEPGNCYWATRKEQGNNTRRNHVVEFEGRRLTISQWSDETGINVNTLWHRLVTNKWPVKKALSCPARGMSNPVVEYGGEKLTVTGWAKRYNLPQGALWLRIFRAKWPIEKALTTPMRSKRGRKKLVDAQ